MNLRKFIIREFYNMLREEDPKPGEGDAAPSDSATTASAKIGDAAQVGQIATFPPTQDALVRGVNNNLLYYEYSNNKYFPAKGWKWIPFIPPVKEGALPLVRIQKDADANYQEKIGYAIPEMINNTNLRMQQITDRNTSALLKLKEKDQASHASAEADLTIAADTNKTIRERASAAARFLTRIWKVSPDDIPPKEGGSPEEYTLEGANIVVKYKGFPYVGGAQNEVPLKLAQEKGLATDTTYDENNPYVFIDKTALANGGADVSVLDSVPLTIPVPFDPEADPFEKYTERTKSFRCRNPLYATMLQKWANDNGAKPRLVEDGDIGNKTLAALRSLAQTQKVNLDDDMAALISAKNNVSFFLNEPQSRVAVCNFIYVLATTVLMNDQDEEETEEEEKTEEEEETQEESLSLRGMILQEILKTLK